MPVLQRSHNPFRVSVASDLHHKKQNQVLLSRPSTKIATFTNRGMNWELSQSDAKVLHCLQSHFLILKKY